MQKHKLKLPSEDDEVRSQKSHYTNVSKISSKHVELSLEVEMDDEVREMIKSPGKGPSALLDVTVIKPKGLDRYTTEKQILKTDQVKKMIASMNLNAEDKNTLMEKLFGNTAPQENDKDRREKNKRTEHRCKKSCLSKHAHNFRQSSIKLEQGDVQCITDDTNSMVYSMYNQSKLAKGSVQPQPLQQIYTSPKTYENIRTMFQCTHKEQRHRDPDKLDQPCLCQNCAIVGILTDSQKKPFATEPIPNLMVTEPSSHRRPLRKKSVSFKHLETPILPSTSRAHAHDQCEAVFKLLSSRINELERRVAMQEEKAVPKDYFKKIITKLVTHLTKLTHYTAEDRSVTSSPRYKDSSQPANKYRSSERHNRYYVNPVLVENTFKIPAEKEYEPKPCTSEEATRPSESFWRWGEEFLSSGRDLKNKVVVLLEDTLHNLKKGWEGPQTQRRFDENMQNMVEELSKNLVDTVRPNTTGQRSPEGASQKARKRVMLETKNTRKPSSNLDKKEAKPSLIPKFIGKKGPSINVAYVSPQLRKWPEESTVSFKVDSSDDYEMQKEIMSDVKKRQFKKEFLKVLDNTKTADKFKLWQNIWNQALVNGQTKNDIVTIQIPDPKDLIRQKIIHLDYTIGELEKLLTCSRHSEDKKK